MSDRKQLPIPPLEMRELVGPTDIAAYDNPTGVLVYPYLPEDVYSSVFDFGCGCGRVARQLIQQHPRPGEYVGIDIHRGMIRWAQQNLQPAADGFHFYHHDVYNIRLNPDGPTRVAPFPVSDNSFSLVHALSVFTHLTEDQAAYYLTEVARTMTDDGYFLGSWFLFDKIYFPMMPPEVNTLYLSYVEPGAAVLYDREWVQLQAENLGLVISTVIPPRIRGHQWVLVMRPAKTGALVAPWPPDDAPIGKALAPHGYFVQPSTPSPKPNSSGTDTPHAGA